MVERIRYKDADRFEYGIVTSRRDDLVFARFNRCGSTSAGCKVTDTDSEVTLLSLFIDDIRPAPSGWQLATSFNEVREFMLTNWARTIHISFDYDMGMDVGDRIIAWILREFSLPDDVVMSIHSAHTYGVKLMREILVSGGWKPEIISYERLCGH